jgi:NDP-4-keto-2,6-dideoxyhexose 3-C-methyltransferase
MNLGHMALTGAFPRPEEGTDKASLQLLRCLDGCGLVQLSETYDLTKMYGAGYGYRSGLNKSMVKHLEDLVRSLLVLQPLREGDVIVDIGSNDGTALGFFPENTRRIGVDPSGPKFKQFYKPGIELIPEFFSARILEPVLNGWKAKVVTSFAMFYDLEDPTTFMKEVAGILADDGIWVMEQSYLPAMMKANAFDTICHEHIEYYSLFQIEWMAHEAGLSVVAVEESSTNGGSFIVMLVKAGATHNGRYTEAPNVAKMRLKEQEAGLLDPLVYEAFRLRSQAAIGVLEEFLVETQRLGMTCCGLGASTKGNVLLQSILDVKKLVRAIGDVNPDKWGCVTPGTGIPILPEDEVLAMNPDYLLVLPWHFKENFIANPKFHGQRLVFPLPQLEIVQL